MYVVHLSAQAQLQLSNYMHPCTNKILSVAQLQDLITAALASIIANNSAKIGIDIVNVPMYVHMPSSV